MNGIKCWSPLLLAMGIGLCIPLARADAPFYNQGLKYEASEKWEEAYKAYVQSVDNKEVVEVDEKDRPIDRAFLIATEHLGRFDEAIALTDKFLADNKDGYLHRLLGYFYKKQLRDYDKAREQFRLSYENFMADDDRLFAALYSLEQQAGCYRTQLFEMDYYANRKYRQSYTRMAHDILLEGFARVDDVEDAWGRNKIRNIYLKSLAYIYSQKWYSGYNPELAKEYEQAPQVNQGGEKTPYQLAQEEYEPLWNEKRWPEAAQLWNNFLFAYPEFTNDLHFMKRVTKCNYFAKDWETTWRVAVMTMDLMDRIMQGMTTDIEKSVKAERSWLASYEYAIVAAQELKHEDLAFDVMERSRARAMLDLLGGRDYSKRQSRISDDEKEVLLLNSRIDEIRGTIEQERKLNRPEEMASLQRSLVLVEDTSTKIQRRMDIARREILSSTQVEPITAQEAQTLIGDDTLISIWTGIYISVITKDKITSREIRGSSNFDKLIRDFREAIENRGSQVRSLALEADGNAPSNATADADAKILAIGQKLYDIIIKPIENDFSKTSDRVYIVYDRSHPLVPYQVLHDGKQYMTEKYTLVYAPSVSVLKKCMERRHPMGGKLLALGNPNLGNPNFNLTYAEDEVKKLADIYPDSRILTGTEASEAAVQLLAPDTEILHFACHGVIDENDPMKSHLRLTPDKNNDGYLTADEIMDLNLQCSLVTLSACDSGRGLILMGGDILGLTRAWIYAGTPSVLASLWKVDDRATSRLMTTFYENLKTHDKAKALQLAQLDMIKEGLSPFYWGAFCLYGDYQ